MLIFLCALQSKYASRDWERVSYLCGRTIQSLSNQTIPQFKIFLVCNEVPDLKFRCPQLEVICGHFPLPEPNTKSRMTDKFAKLGAGAYAARSLAPAHFMAVDADDYVSNRLAAFVAAHQEANGWYFDTGYVHEHGSRWVLLQQNFHLLCGTSTIIRYTLEDLPSSPRREESPHSLVYLGHGVRKDRMEELGRPLAPLPFPGAMYEVGTGENDSGFSLRTWPGFRVTFDRLLRLRPLTSKMRREFTLS